ncbi:MAG: class I SAM-dependent RNA methyltransferase [Polyangiaceae bacterium]|nr:class I SAM-dependent RNA methyltransferase [Polyangiaceae bacterium]
MKAQRSRSETHTLRIESIAKGGDGVAHLNGRAVLIPHTAPDDIVEATVEQHGSVRRGRVLRIVQPSPDRVIAPCPLVGTCGGCDLMHLAVAAQERTHRAIAEDALRRVGGIAEHPPVITHAPRAASDAALEYRTRARLFARVDRGRITIGFRAEGTHDLVCVDRCAVLVSPLNSLLTELPSVLEGAAGSGEISIALGATAPDGAKSVHTNPHEPDASTAVRESSVRTAENVHNEAGTLASSSVRIAPVVHIAWRGSFPVSVWARINKHIQNRTWAGAGVLLDGATEPATFGDPRPVVPGADGRPLRIAAGGFAQASDAAAVVLARRVADLVRNGSNSVPSIVELFAGSGTLSIVLAPLTTKFTSVESHAESVRTARENFELRGLSGKLVCADADNYDIGRAEVVVLDPPREGARGAAQRIAKSRARSVVYIACDPVTMARDIAVLCAEAFRISHVETVELFPHTSHVETLVRLVRR